jgi:hypothetical protein
MTVYRIAAGRGFDDATGVLGADYAGVLERDGWAPYRKFHPRHPPELPGAPAAPLRRVARRRPPGSGQDSPRGSPNPPRALAVRDTRDASRLEATDAVASAERLDAAVDKLIAGRTANSSNRRLLAHLAREHPALFTFLRTPGSRRPTGALSTPSAPPWSAARPGRQPHLGWGPELADPGQRPAHRDPAAPRPNRAAGRAAAGTRPRPGQPRYPHPSARPVAQPSNQLRPVKGPTCWTARREGREPPFGGRSRTPREGAPGEAPLPR